MPVDPGDSERDGNEALVCITDNGQGFDVSRLEHGRGDRFGLVFMRERMAQIGGYLRIESAPCGGTVLTLGVPIGKNLEEAKGSGVTPRQTPRELDDACHRASSRAYRPLSIAAGRT